MQLVGISLSAEKTGAVSARVPFYGTSVSEAFNNMAKSYLGLQRTGFDIRQEQDGKAAAICRGRAWSRDQRDRLRLLLGILQRFVCIILSQYRLRRAQKGKSESEAHQEPLNFARISGISSSVITPIC